MTKNIIIAVLAVLVVVLGFNAFNSYIYEEKQGTAMEDAMHDMTTGLEGKTGAEFDEAFLEGMIAHHDGAVVMAELALQHSAHAELKAMAEDIIVAQTAEIKQMREWQLEWFAGADASAHSTHE